MAAVGGFNPQSFTQLNESFKTGDNQKVSNSKHIRFEDKATGTRTEARGVYTQTGLHDISYKSTQRRAKKFESGAQQVKNLVAKEVGPGAADRIFSKLSQELGKNLNKEVQVKHLDRIQQEVDKENIRSDRTAINSAKSDYRELRSKGYNEGTIDFASKNLKALSQPAFWEASGAKMNTDNFAPLLALGVLQNAMEAGELTKQDIDMFNQSFNPLGDDDKRMTLSPDLAGPLSSGDRDSKEVNDRKTALAEAMFLAFVHRDPPGISNSGTKINVADNEYKYVGSKMSGDESGQAKLDAMKHGYLNIMAGFPSYNLSEALNHAATELSPEKTGVPDLTARVRPENL